MREGDAIRVSMRVLAFFFFVAVSMVLKSESPFKCIRKAPCLKYYYVDVYVLYRKTRRWWRNGPSY